MRSKISKLRETHSTTATSLLDAATDLRDKQESLEDLLEAKALVQEAALFCQTSCQEKISHIVTRCLEAVFGESAYRFELKFEEKRNQTEATALLVDSDGNELSPTDGVGGGVLDVAAFGLRLACLVLQRPAPAKVLVLDEAFRNLSFAYRPNAAQMLVELASDFGVQLILVTHFAEFSQVGKVLEIGK